MSGVLRYAPRHFADLLMTRGAAMVTIGILMILPVFLGAQVGDLESGLELEQLVRLFGELLVPLGVFFTLLASYGMAGADMRQGFYRFMFAKPISPVRYYALSYALTTVVFLIGLLATVGVFAVLIRPVWPQSYLGEIIAHYFLLSTMIMLFSTMTNGDWVVALVALGLSEGLRISYPKDESFIGRVLDIILPPTDSGRLFPLDGGVKWEPLLVKLGYALFLYILALVIVRKMPMGSAT